MSAGSKIGRHPFPFMISVTTLTGLKIRGESTATQPIVGIESRHSMGKSAIRDPPFIKKMSLNGNRNVLTGCQPSCPWLGLHLVCEVPVMACLASVVERVGQLHGESQISVFTLPDRGGRGNCLNSN